MSQEGSTEEPTPDEVVWLSTKQAAARAGLHPSTLLKKVNEGEITAYRTSRNFKFKKHEIDEYVERTRVQPGELDDLLRNWWPNYKRP